MYLFCRANTLIPPFCFLLLCISCKTSGPGLFGKKTPHAQYSDRLTDAGLQSTALGSSWFKVAEQSLSGPASITIPYSETGYFAADRPSAAGLRFPGRRGQKLVIQLQKRPATNFTVYMDLWKGEEAGTRPKHIAAADTSGNSIQHEVEENGHYILRLQPELLSSGEYTITISSGPSLAYPIKAPGTNHIKSFWGADRDGGARKHEGIDMFAARRTPVVAAAPGRITRVHETPIGGKVVWLRVDDKNYTLYYAHLDSQLVADGQKVRTGDTLGLMGNTGNAQTTSPHLHFGVYTFGGPVDPLPFVDPVAMTPAKIVSPTHLLGKLGRIDKPKSRIYNEPIASTAGGLELEENTPLRVEAATSNWFKVTLPNNQSGFIRSNSVADLDKPLRKFSVESIAPVFDRPDSLAAKKTSISSGEPVDILATYENYHLIKTRQNITGWIVK